jgi:RNA polymerase sigma-70 factor (ECF subfamily)
VTTGSVPNSVGVSRDDEAVDLDRAYREHAARVSSWVRRLTGMNDVSDILQEVFEVAQRKLASFRGDAQFTTWLYSITVRVVHARRRKARLRRLLLLEAQAQFDLDTKPVATPADSLQQRQATRMVYTVLDQLPERDRTLLILFELERLATSEIAAIVQISENNVAVSLHRARERFRTRFRRQFPEETRGMDDGKANR